MILMVKTHVAIKTIMLQLEYTHTNNKDSHHARTKVERPNEESTQKIQTLKKKATLCNSRASALKGRPYNPLSALNTLG